jgi:hypothetical protein
MPTPKRPEQLRALIADLRLAVDGEYCAPPGLELIKPLPPKEPNPPSGRVWLDRIAGLLEEPRRRRST